MTDLLTLIENADPTDDAVLDEIDAHIFCFLHNATLDEMRIFMELPSNNHAIRDILFNSPERKYTRSLDAIKSIEPDEWDMVCVNVQVLSGNREIYVDFGKSNTFENNKTPLLPTEQLARLHAVISAIKYERAQNE